jgi:hypothetical protein
LLSFSLIFQKTRKAIQHFKISGNLPVAHGLCGALRINFSNFQNFAADSKMFENFAADSKNLAGNLPVAHHICILVAHWAVRYG